MWPTCKHFLWGEVQEVPGSNSKGSHIFPNSPPIPFFIQIHALRNLGEPWMADFYEKSIFR